MGLLDSGHCRILEPGMPLNIVHMKARIGDPREQTINKSLKALRIVPGRFITRMKVPEFVVLTCPQVAVPLVVLEGLAERWVARIENEQDHTCCEEIT